MVRDSVVRDWIKLDFGSSIGLDGLKQWIYRVLVCAAVSSDSETLRRHCVVESNDCRRILMVDFSFVRAKCQLDV